MISQMDKFRRGPLAETEIQVPGMASQEDRALSRLNQNFRVSKAQQILRLLRDQDDLNQRFRDCALLDDDDDDTRPPGAGGGQHGRQDPYDDPDTWSTGEEQPSDHSDDDSDASGHEAERRAARSVALRKHRNSIDPGRCKTSMGFHNRAEVTDIPYDTDSDNVAGADSACSTPRGVSSGALSARQPAISHLHHHNHHHNHGLYGKVTATPTATATTPRPAPGAANSRLRAYQLNIGDGDPQSTRDSGDAGEECVVQSARSCRPKTSLASMAGSRSSRYYRQQPHPESQSQAQAQARPALSSKQATGTVHHSPNYHSRPQHGPLQHQHSVGDTRQAIISRLDPHHPMAVRPFCGSQEDVYGRPAAQWQASSPSSSSQPSTPRGGGGGVPKLHHTEVTLFDMAPKDSPTSGGAGARRGAAGGGGVGRAPSFNTDQHQQFMMPAGRLLLSVDSSPVPLSSPRGPMVEDPGTPRRMRSTPRMKKRTGDSTPRGMVPATPVQPAMTLMKLPPLESQSGKGGSGRDLLCIGKD